MLRCADGTFYIGWTNDLAARLKAHNTGRGAKYTKSRRPVEVVYFETFPEKREAMKREAALKKLSRKEKEKLAAGFVLPENRIFDQEDNEMTERQEQIVKNVDRHREMIMNAERYLWMHPETGYKEWQAHAYLSEAFEKLGYTLTCAGNIPGFFTELDTGRPGPCLAIMGELDALDLSTHPEAVNGCAHACGHNGQGAAMLGIAAALLEDGALDGLSGKIRLYMVPAEEMIELSYREELRKQGVIRYNGGKPEFMYRGLFDGVDIAMMVHGAAMSEQDFWVGRGMNGCISKIFTYKGKASHAGGSPDKGINAEYAAMLGLEACNALRETFRDNEHIRFHPIMLGVHSAVNIIPDEMKVESYVRANSIEAMKRENRKINRALSGTAAAVGASLFLSDRPGYAPEVHDPSLMCLVGECCTALVGRNRVEVDYEGWDTGSSDFGDLTMVMPGIQFDTAGASGHGHGIDYQITDPEKLCLNSAKAQLFVADALLSDGASKAKSIIENYKPAYPSIKAYLEALDEFMLDKEAVCYHDDGSVTLEFLA